ncbi:Transposase (plasmid) [Halomicrobium sp. LC1Hm]|nr:Transposase [Halomicrobium sp. LC1Hm]
MSQSGETDQLLEVVPQSEQDEAVLRRLLDASASLWNQLTYARRQQFFAGKSVWDCENYYDEYVDETYRAHQNDRLDGADDGDGEHADRAHKREDGPENLPTASRRR